MPQLFFKKLLYKKLMQNIIEMEADVFILSYIYIVLGNKRSNNC
jgi:hypothetical protein